MSWQKKHFPQSLAVQCSHTPHLFLFFPKVDVFIIASTFINLSNLKGGGGGGGAWIDSVFMFSGSFS